jgi:hypothetical protein
MQSGRWRCDGRTSKNEATLAETRQAILPNGPWRVLVSPENPETRKATGLPYNPDDAEQGTPSANLRRAVWYLVRQDLYLNDQATAFLIFHWKHTLNLISLLDVIPGDGTELISQ